MWKKHFQPSPSSAKPWLPISQKSYTYRKKLIYLPQRTYILTTQKSYTYEEIKSSCLIRFPPYSHITPLVKLSSPKSLNNLITSLIKRWCWHTNLVQSIR